MVWKFLVMMLVFLTATTNAYAIDGVWHAPYGNDDLYEIQATERYPRDPIAGENVYVKITTWPIEPGQATWITWSKNGVPQPDIGGAWKYNSGNNTYWEVSMGSFSKGDVINYTVHGNKDGTNEKTVGPFQFTVTSWESIQRISGYTNSGNPSISEERSPWNAQARTGDSTIISTFRKYANTRMNLLPYIYSEAKKTSDTGVPMMRATVLDYPQDTNTYGLTSQYMFGDNLLVAPVVNQGETNKSIYLPRGEWIDFWWGAQRPSGRTITYYAGADDIPVFVKSGSIIPMNLNANYELGGSIGNNLNSYSNLTFRIYPNGTTSYNWYDDIGGSVKTIASTEQYSANTETVSLPPINSTSTLQVFTTKPSSVTLDGNALTQYASLSALQGASQGWYYDPVQKFAYVKTASAAASRTVVLNGVNKVEYEAEFAALNNVTTNTNHAGYSGTGFVDGFATVGDSVQFDVSVKTTGSYTVDFKYSSAADSGSRAIYVNGAKVQDLSLPQTVNWDTWGVASTTLSLNAGLNTITVSYDANNSLGINLDNFAIHER